MMTKKIFSPLLILILSIGMSACSGDKEPSGGGTPASGFPDYPKDPDGVIDSFLKWFTEDVFHHMAPLTYPGGSVMDGRVSHTSCYCAGNIPCKSDERFYTYEAFKKAIRYYPEMFIDKTTGVPAIEEQQRRIITAYFANVAQETNGSWDPDIYTPVPDPQPYFVPEGLLCYAEEAGYRDDTPGACGYETAPNGYCYNGRGPLQITHVYNYTSFSQAFFGDDRLAKDPREVSQDPILAFVSSFWFFSNYLNDGFYWSKLPIKGLSQFMIHPRDYNGKRDFAYTIFQINGGLECSSAGSEGQRAMAHRVESFKTFYKYIVGDDFNDPDDKLSCEDMSNDMLLATAPLWEDTHPTSSTHK